MLMLNVFNHLMLVMNINDNDYKKIYNLRSETNINKMHDCLSRHHLYSPSHQSNQSMPMDL